MFHKQSPGTFQINEILLSQLFWLLPLVIAALILVVVLVLIFLFLSKRKKRSRDVAVVRQEARIPKKIEPYEEILKELSSLSKEISEIKKYLKELTGGLERFVAKFPSLAGALTSYSLTPISNLHEAAKYLNVDEIVIFLDNGLPLESYPLPVDEKKTGILLEIYRSTEELIGENVKRIAVLLPEGTIAIYKIEVNARKFYVAYKAKAGIEEDLLDLQRALIEDYIKKRIREWTE